ncbi:ABC transporter permease subunit [Escherichia coli]|uniref:ABC transporter permease subunit n=1 Tax=Escherichia coli TaxID=562 RepID=UPI0025A56633|nr:ABC transporter permease subunit [Escherichia coli]EIO1502435.1 ABC transporter permease subunit [Escherichia coli]
MSIDWNWGIFLQQAPFGNTTYLGWIWSGFQVTIALSICAWIIAFLVGSFFGILRTVPNRFLSGLGTLYVELFRNVPLIVQFFTWYLVIPELLPEKIGMWFKAELDPNIQFFLSSMLCLGLFTAITLAYVLINAFIMLVMTLVERKVRLPGNMGGK